MKLSKSKLLLLCSLAFLFACGGGGDTPDVPDVPDEPEEEKTRPAWYADYPSNELTGDGTKTTFTSEEVRLSFFGWSYTDDYVTNVNFPTYEPGKRKAAILTYRMGAWKEGPSAWDITTMIYVKDKTTGEWFELVRAFTPYGNSFNSTWERKYYFDITDYMPLLSGDTEFRVYYGGFDATETRAHTVTLTFDFFEGEPEKLPVWRAKVYDSAMDGNSGYRGYAYGVPGADIEAPERMGLRSFTVPTNVDELELRVAISGHGHDQGVFVDRSGYTTRNAAEFDENFYTIKINGAALEEQGRIFRSCANNYYQAGTYTYDRANWCPGQPLQTQWWDIPSIPSNREVTVDIDLEKFVSEATSVKAEGVAQYIVTVDLVGYQNK